MATQLRLVETVTPPRPGGERPSSTKRQARASGTAAPKPRRTQGARRAAQWGEWRLDARTRRVGRAGVAKARRALAHLDTDEDLSRAS